MIAAARHCLTAISSAKTGGMYGTRAHGHRPQPLGGTGTS